MACIWPSLESLITCLGYINWEWYLKQQNIEINQNGIFVINYKLNFQKKWRTDPVQKTHQWLHMIPGNRITNKSQRFASEDFQELGSIKQGKLTVIRLPPPFQELSVRSSIFPAVLMLMNGPTGLIGVVRSTRIWHPFSTENIAHSCCFCSIS